MANNFYNKIAQNVSADHNVPTWLYSVPTSKKTIVIELDVANRSSSSQTISVVIDDFTARGANVVSTVAAIATNTIVTATHGYSTGDRIRLTNATAPTTILNGGVATNPGANGTPIIFSNKVPLLNQVQIIDFGPILRFSVDKVVAKSIVDVIPVGHPMTQLVAGVSLVIAQGSDPLTLVDPGALMADASLRVTTYYHIYDTA